MKVNKTGVFLLSIAVLGGLLVFPAISQQDTANQQPRYKNADTRQNLATLASDSRQNPKTLAAAILWLGSHEVVAAVPGLIKELDFQLTDLRPTTEGSIIKGPDRWIEPEEEFPAITALFQIGAPALPSLERAIADNESSSTVSQNAVLAVQLIFRGNLGKAVNSLRAAAAECAKPDKKMRLERAAADTASKLKRMSDADRVKPQ